VKRASFEIEQRNFLKRATFWIGEVLVTTPKSCLTLPSCHHLEICEKNSFTRDPTSPVRHWNQCSISSCCGCRWTSYENFIRKQDVYSGLGKCAFRWSVNHDPRTASTSRSETANAILSSWLWTGERHLYSCLKINDAQHGYNASEEFSRCFSSLIAGQRWTSASMTQATSSSRVDREAFLAMRIHGKNVTSKSAWTKDSRNSKDIPAIRHSSLTYTSWSTLK